MTSLFGLIALVISISALYMLILRGFGRRGLSEKQYAKLGRYFHWLLIVIQVASLVAGVAMVSRMWVIESLTSLGSALSSVFTVITVIELIIIWLASLYIAKHNKKTGGWRK